MTHLRSILLSLLLTGTLVAEDAPEALLTLAPDLALPGRLMSLDATQIAWRVFGSGVITNIAVTNVKSIDYRSNPSRRTGPTGGDRALLTNGDTYRGRISAINGQRLSIETAYAEALTLQRTMLQRLDIHRDGDDTVYYQGPGNMGDWKEFAVKPGSWRLDGNRLVARERATIGTPLNLPDRFRIRFTAFAPERFQFRIRFCSTGLAASATDAYVINVLQSALYFSREGRTTGSRNIGTARGQHLAPGKAVDFALYVQRDTGRVSLYVNDAHLQTWVDPTPTDTLGSDLLFASQSASPLEISDIRITDWSEQSLPRQFEAPTNPALDVIHLANGDAALGALVAAKDAHALIETAHTAARIPFTRVVSVDFGLAAAHRPRLFPGDARIHFNDGTYITLELRGLRRGRLLGYSESAGSVQVDLKQIRTIEMNIYRDFNAQVFRRFAL